MRLALPLTPVSLARVLGLVLTLLIAAFYVAGFGLLDLLELKTYDMRLRALPGAPADRVTIAAIDEKSLSELGRWPWSRETLARLVERLEQSGARVIAFDVFFPEEESPAADTRLARAIRQHGRVVLSTVFLLDESDTRHLGAETLDRARRALEPQAIGAIRRTGEVGEFPMPAPRAVLINVPRLQEAALHSGHINVMPDADGTLRRAPLIVRYGEHYFPSADVMAARAFLDDAAPLLNLAPYGVVGLDLGNRFIPTDEFGRMLIRYLGPERTFATVSAADILHGRADAGLLRDRVVLIGPTAKGIGDIRVTPWSPVFPGVEVRASIIQGLIAGGFLQRPEWMAVFDTIVIVVLGFALAWWLPKLSVRTGAAAAAAVLFAWLAAASIAFRAEGLWLTVVHPALLVVALFVSTTLVQYFSTENERRRIKTAFQYYVPAKVVDEIVADVNKLKLGGEKRELTVLFSDIRGFTAIAEQLAPEELVRLLNLYLTRMTEQVFRHDGLLDKYVGDAIMAVYGAPIPRADHAVAACRTALDMMRELLALQAQWRAAGRPVLDIGIGINTGPMVVGNMGSETRFDYTVIGDAVNLGSRIEAMNKIYGTHILLSEFTHRQVREAFPALREIDVARIRGREQPVRLFELIPENRYPSLDWLPEFARAYRLYHTGAVVEALAVFERLAREIGDPVSRYYTGRGFKTAPLEARA
jgi:adenylate cyclase